jgi:hypothetical protein
LSYCYQWITIFLHSNCKARAFARALQFENWTIDCNPLVAEGEYVSPITKDSKVSNFVVNDYFAVLQIKSMTSVCWHFLSVNVPLLAALSQHNIKTTTCSSINHYKFHSEFLSAEIHEIWLLHYLKITENFKQRVKKMLFLSLTKIISLT